MNEAEKLFLQAEELKETNPVEAAMLYNRAAEFNYAPAQCCLGKMYEAGRGVGQNHLLAFIWYRQAAENGFAEAQYRLALCYAYARGTKRDDAKAQYWKSVAAENGYEY